MKFKAIFSRLIRVVNMAKSTNNLAHSISTDMKNTTMLVIPVFETLHKQVLLFSQNKPEGIIRSLIHFFNCQLLLTEMLVYRRNGFFWPKTVNILK